MRGSIKAALSPSSVIRFDCLCLPEPKINASDQTILSADTSGKPVTLQCNLTTAHTAHKDSFWMKNGQKIPNTQTEQKNTAYRWRTFHLCVVSKTYFGREHSADNKCSQESEWEFIYNLSKNFNVIWKWLCKQKNNTEIIIAQSCLGLKQWKSGEILVRKFWSTGPCWDKDFTLIGSKFEIGVLLTFSERVTQVCFSAWLTKCWYFLVNGSDHRVAQSFTFSVLQISSQCVIFCAYPTDMGETTTHQS